jgi:hypothetical protein
MKIQHAYEAAWQDWELSDDAGLLGATAADEIDSAGEVTGSLPDGPSVARV